MVGGWGMQLREIFSFATAERLSVAWYSQTTGAVSSWVGGRRYFVE